MSRFIIIFVVVMIISRILKSVPRTGGESSRREIPRPGQDPNRPGPDQNRPEPPLEQAPVWDICRRCGSLVEKRATRCPSCGKVRKTGWIWVMILIVALAIAMFWLALV
ncbi:MAG: hypothetical protein K0B87_00860 [Candidatus Syntrophosphaera sp.]|nr:hypothetical protein [Candidatus Syntrophosphaera sp.]